MAVVVAVIGLLATSGVEAAKPLPPVAFSGVLNRSPDTGKNREEAQLVIRVDAAISLQDTVVTVHLPHGVTALDDPRQRLGPIAAGTGLTAVFELKGKIRAPLRVDLEAETASNVLLNRSILVHVSEKPTIRKKPGRGTPPSAGGQAVREHPAH